MQRAVLIGSNGQLGSEITRIWPARSAFACVELAGLTHAELEITDCGQVEHVLGALQPDIVINTAGFLRVDECESVPEKAVQVNGLAAAHLAGFCRGAGSLLVHLSTDYVFDGRKRTPYTEDDRPDPLNAYGLSKLMGEAFVRYLLPDSHIIVRTSGLFGPAGSSNKGGNFVETMLRLAAAGKALRVVDDQVFSPSYAPDLAEALLDLIEAGGRGTFHITNSGVASWYQLALQAFELASIDADLSPTTSAAYAAPARRPGYSVLDNTRAQDLTGTKLPAWQDALERYFVARRVAAANV